MGKLLAGPWKVVCEEIGILLCDMSQHEGQSYRVVPLPPLLELLVTMSCPFECTGVDFAGPMYIRRTADVKVWL